MSSILIRQSDGLVVAAAATITYDGSANYTLTESNGFVSIAPENAFGAAVSIVTGVTPPTDLIPGWNYKYVSGSFVSTGLTPPTPTPPSPWLRCQNLSVNTFLSLIFTVLGATAYNRLTTDANAKGIFDVLMASSTVMPNYIDQATGQNLFLNSLNYLLVTNAATDGQPLMTTANVAAIQDAWP